MVEEYRDMNGHIRMLARLEPNENHMKMRAAMTSIEEYRQKQGLPEYIPESEWFPRDNQESFDTSFIVDQHQCNGCSGFSGAAARMKTWFLATGEKVVLSGAYLYARNNGGQDQGSVITDIMRTLMSEGVCLETSFHLPNIYDHQISQAARQEADKFRETLCLTFTNWKGAMTASLMGFNLQFGVRVGPRFESRIDDEMFAGFDPGIANHSVHSDGHVVTPSRRWGLTMQNTWGLWGPKRNGRVLIGQEHVDGGNMEGFAHGSGLTRPPKIAA